MAFFYFDYRAECFYWEAIECMRKLLLTGVAVLVVPGSLMQVMAAMFVVVLYIVALLVYKPYRKERDNHIALTLYGMLAVTFVCGLLLKVEDGFEGNGKYSLGFNTTWITVVLIFTVLSVLAGGIALIIRDFKHVMNEPLLQYAISREIVALPSLGEKHNFDLFLSHAQDLGQDQVATIKASLLNLFPYIKIFLDVESLDDIHALDELVSSSKNILIFLTAGCLRRYFVRLEVSTAVDKGVNAIVVQVGHSN
jgi:hypothetical protein